MIMMIVITMIIMTVIIMIMITVIITIMIIILIRTGVPPADCRLCSTRGWPRVAWLLLYNEVDLVVVRMRFLFVILRMMII